MDFASFYNNQAFLKQHLADQGFADNGAAYGDQPKKSKYPGGEINKIFVGGLGDCPQEVFDQYFGQFGEIIDSIVMMNKSTGKSRGFGFVHFADPAVADQVVQQAKHVLYDREVEVKKTFTKPGFNGSENFAAAPQAFPLQATVSAAGVPVIAGPLTGMRAAEAKGMKIFVGGIGPDTTTDSLKAYFEQWGALLDGVVMTDKITGKPRGFGFVTYVDPECGEAALQAGDRHEVDGKVVEVKRTTPRPRDMQAQAQLHQQNLGGVPMFAHQVQAPSQPFLQPLGQLQPGFSATPGQMATDKVFISGLAPDCDENALVAYFGQFGQLIDAHLKYCPSTGLSRGCGFVQFDHFQSVDAVMEHGQPMEIDGRTLEISCNKHLVHNRFVEVKRSLSQDVAQAQAIPLGPPGFQAQAHFHHAGIQQPAGGVDKVFVGGIGDCNEQEFIRYFEQFGAIVDYVVMKDKETGKPRGFGFVRYESQESVEQVLSPEMYRQHLLRGKWIEVKRASPEVKGAGKGSPGHRFAPY